MTSLYLEVKEKQDRERIQRDLERIANGAMRPSQKRKRTNWFARLLAKAKRRKMR